MDNYDNATGLVAFIRSRFPDRDDLVVFEPKQDEPHRGYFPAGKICEIFDGEFRQWSRLIRGDRRADKREHGLVTGLIGLLKRKTG